MEISWIAKHLLWFFLLLISLTIHEWSHAFVANKLGDPTPENDGRVTLNPLAHIDIFGTIIFPLLCIFLSTGILFGWGRPVVINSSNFKKPKLYATIAECAGILGNLLLCFISSIILSFNTQLYTLAYNLLELNAVLIAISFLPLPGMDGFYLIKNIFKLSNTTVNFLENWGFFIMIILIQIPLIRLFLSLIVNSIIGIFIKMSVIYHGFFV